ncbi:IS5 family transposase [Comamonas sp. BIGb0152]|nr:IS5 family transposase [Comamonas sp. BIGb0152]
MSVPRKMHLNKKGNLWYFGTKCHIGVESNSGLHTMVSTPGNEANVSHAHRLLHGHALGDSGYQGAGKCAEAKCSQVRWHIAMRKKLYLGNQLGMPKEKYEQTKVSMRATVEHLFCIVKHQFRLNKVRYRGIDKNDNKLQTMFALSNLWLVRKQMMRVQA